MVTPPTERTDANKKLGELYRLGKIGTWHVDADGFYVITVHYAIKRLSYLEVASLYRDLIRRK